MEYHVIIFKILFYDKFILYWLGELLIYNCTHNAGIWKPGKRISYSSIMDFKFEVFCRM